MILNQVFDAINIGIVILDREMKVKKWNRVGWRSTVELIPIKL